MVKALPTRKLNLVSRDLGGEMLLYNGHDGAVHVLNGTACLIWELCDGQHTRGDMEEAVRARFSTVDRDVRGDVDRLLQMLAAKGLLEWVD